MSIYEHIISIQGKRIKHAVGDVYGQMTIVRIERVKSKKGESEKDALYCTCSCGNPRIFKSNKSALTASDMYLGSCGCMDDDPEYQALNVEGWIHRAMKDINDRIKKKKLGPTDIDMDYIRELYRDCGGFCTMTNVKLKVHTIRDRHGNTPSIDRIDSNLGYVRGNVRITSWDFNNKKGEDKDDQFITFSRNFIAAVDAREAEVEAETKADDNFPTPTPNGVVTNTATEKLKLYAKAKEKFDSLIAFLTPKYRIIY
jgi:hypothetical protein